MSFRLALAQINPTVGDIGHNAQTIAAMAKRAREQAVDVVVFPELCLCGYPPEDLLHKPGFLQDNIAALEGLLPEIRGLTALVGFAQPDHQQCYNAAAVIRDGVIASIYHKGQLPNYGVFDEKRYFVPGRNPLVIEQGPTRIAVTICEDIWDIRWLDSYLGDYRGHLDLIVNLSASPFYAGKIKDRQAALVRCSRHFNCAAAYCNLVGGQDELVFDGRSMIVTAQGTIAAQAKAFDEDLYIADIEHHAGRPLTIHPISNSFFSDQNDIVEEVWQALVLGTRDYVRKNGFSRVVVGLSGGIDSSLVAAVAVEALGRQNVIGITMPSRFNSAETRSDAQTLASRLGIEFHTIPISDILDIFSRTLGKVDGWSEQGLAYENLQARIRGTILMSYSNQFGWLVLTTGNKSETAVGYSTLYGDTAGGFAVIKDVPKTLVYKLSAYYNDRAGQPIIPESVITRAPSAELRPNQKDTDSLPDYDLLDAILKNYIELDHSAADLIHNGFPEEQVRRVLRLVDKSEYKRRQCPPGIKITPRAFGKDRRMPITNKYNP